MIIDKTKSFAVVKNHGPELYYIDAGGHVLSEYFDTFGQALLVADEINVAIKYRDAEMFVSGLQKAVEIVLNEPASISMYGDLKTAEAVKCALNWAVSAIQSKIISYAKTPLQH